MGEASSVPQNWLVLVNCLKQNYEMAEFLSEEEFQPLAKSNKTSICITSTYLHNRGCHYRNCAARIPNQRGQHAFRYVFTTQEDAGEGYSGTRMGYTWVVEHRGTFPKLHTLTARTAGHG